MDIALSDYNIASIKLPYPLEWQRPVIESDEYWVILGGRRVGKTQIGIYKILKSAIRIVGLYWWVGLSWRSASLKRAWRLLKFYARQIWRATGRKDTGYIREADKEITLPNGSSIWMRTSEKPDSLAGEAVMGVVVDEFTLMPELVWTEYIEATLADNADNGSWAMFIGVAKGIGWHSELWNKAKLRKNWRQLRVTTYDNPRISREWLEETRENSTKLLFEQEYLAIVHENEGSVFKFVYQVCSLDEKWCLEPVENHLYVFGLDWAKQNDFSTLCILDILNHREVLLDRWQETDFSTQINRALKHLTKWQPKFGYVERNSIGEMPFQELRKRYRYANEWLTTQDTKEQAIIALAHAFERTGSQLGGGILLLDTPYGINELLKYQQERLPSGRWRYGAQTGEHDDTVIARALAWQAKLHYKRNGGIYV